MYKRINITLPDSTLALIDKAAKKGDRSNFINTAIKHYVREIEQEALRTRLKDGAIARAKRDASLIEK